MFKRTYLFVGVLFCSLIKGITPKNPHAVFCPNTLRSFEPLMRLDSI